MRQEVIKQAVEAYGTPLYVFDLDALRERAVKIRRILAEDRIRLCYAMKANPFLTGAMKGLADCLEVCSPGEMRICEREGVPMEQLVISGVNKEQEEISRMVRTYGGKGIFTIESAKHLAHLADCAAAEGVPLSVLVRLTSGNQFGVDWQEAKEMIAQNRQYPQLHFIGIQYYSGTQKRKAAVLKKEFQRLSGFCREVKEELGTKLSEIEYGPGFPVSYFQSEEELEEEEFLREFQNMVRNTGFPGTVTLEMGRFLSALCGSYAVTLADSKQNQGQRYGIVDGGIHQMNYYGQMMAMKMPYVVHIQSQEKDEDSGSLTEEKWNICGSLCTTADVIVKQLPLKGAKIGDILVFTRTGAYSVTEGISLFLSRDLPKVCSYSGQEGLRLMRDTIPTDGMNSGSMQNHKGMKNSVKIKQRTGD